MRSAKPAMVSEEYKAVRFESPTDKWVTPNAIPTERMKTVMGPRRGFVYHSRTFMNINKLAVPSAALRKVIQNVLRARPKIDPQKIADNSDNNKIEFRWTVE